MWGPALDNDYAIVKSIYNSAVDVEITPGRVKYDCQAGPEPAAQATASSPQL
jgi:hypothetical protein